MNDFSTCELSGEVLLPIERKSVQGKLAYRLKINKR